jgi:hypothetical protein
VVSLIRAFSTFFDRVVRGIVAVSAEHGFQLMTRLCEKHAMPFVAR